MKTRHFTTKEQYLQFVDELIPVTLTSVERRATAERDWKRYCREVGRNPLDTGAPPNPEAADETAQTTASYLRNALAYAESVAKTTNSRFTVPELAEAQLALWGRGPDGRLL